VEFQASYKWLFRQFLLTICLRSNSLLSKCRTYLKINVRSKLRLINFIFILIATCIIFLDISISQESPSSSKKTLHGVIAYKLIDLETNRVLSSNKINVNQVNTKKENILGDPEEIYFEDVYIKLYDDFIIGMNNYGYKDKRSITGFGIWLNRLNSHTFSWEWYNQTNEHRYKKLQGNGELEVEYKKRDGYWVISKIKFIGEHTFRAKKINIFTMVNPSKEDWHCIILDGSYIEW